MITFKNVTKYYKGEDKPAIKDLNLEIERGKITVFLGKSGCGKSTTLKLINRMESPSDGVIEVDGKKITEFEEYSFRRNIGYVIQDVGLLPNKTVAQNIGIVPKLKKWNKEDIDRRVEELITMIGLDPQVEGKKYPRHLSGGQAQRVGVARGLAAKPDILLMDEPFGAVDPITRSKLQADLLKIHRSEKKTICFVTHDIDEAIKVADKIAIFNEGRVTQYDTPINILMKPSNQFVRDFVGETRVLQAMKIISLKDLFVRSKGIRLSESSEEKVSLEQGCSVHDVISSLIDSGKSIVSIVDENKDIITEVSLYDIFRRLNEEQGHE